MYAAPSTRCDCTYLYEKTEKIRILLKSQKSEETKKPPKVSRCQDRTLVPSTFYYLEEIFEEKLTTANYLPVPFEDRDSAVFHQFLITR